MNKTNYLRGQYTWSISKKLLFSILEDKVSDIFVCELVWERLFYVQKNSIDDWLFTKKTPLYWSQKFIKAPQIISERSASIHLTRSIPKNHKQGLKQILNFKGYKINELFPRRTRRATAVNWLIYWSIQSKNKIPKEEDLPEFSLPPINPLKGHSGDPDIK